MKCSMYSQDKNLKITSFLAFEYDHQPALFITVFLEILSILTFL